MKNVYDIKRDEGLNFILPTQHLLDNRTENLDDVLIVVHLFYEDRLEKYLEYIEHIPSDINILFTTSSDKMQNLIIMYMKTQKKRYKIIRKENRGRDISGLLVACRKEILQYKYVCFLHDKKEKNEYIKADTEIFIKCLWENTIGSKNYILNVLSILKQYPKLGVLLPPEPVSDRFSVFFRNTWDENFELMCSLAKRMNLNCDLNREKKPISVGTVFWAKVDAIKKLLEIEWTYKDFDQEPLAVDGTISHAIERCFAYVAQDAGYYTGIIMTNQYAEKRFDYLQQAMTMAFDRMAESLNIRTIYELKMTNQIYAPLLKFAKQYTPLYIYGAGKYGISCAKLLQASLYKIEGFLVSEIEENQNSIKDIPLISILQLELAGNSGIIVAANKKNREEMIKVLKEKWPMFKHVFFFNFG